jgi:hypothetical protein
LAPLSPAQRSQQPHTRPLSFTSGKPSNPSVHLPSLTIPHRTYYQDPASALIEKAYDASTGWFLGAFSVPSALPRTCLSCCCFGVTNSAVSIRVYYEGANNRLLEKGYDGGNWYDGAFNQPCIPGTESAVIFWSGSAGVSLRVYFQNGTEVSGVSEWMWNGKWAQGVKAIPPA